MSINPLQLTSQQRGRFGVFNLESVYCVQVVFVSMAGNCRQSLGGYFDYAPRITGICHACRNTRHWLRRITTLE